MTVVVKLGGSVITRKGERETIDDDALEQAVATVADAPADVILVHGGGSFGHPIADEHGLSRTRGSHDAAAALDVHDAMGLLSDTIVSRLQDFGAAALPVHPLSAGVRDVDGKLYVATRVVREMLAEGFLPVLHGDVVVHSERGVTIVSGDELVVALASAFEVDRVGLCSSVPGVLDERGEVIPRIGSEGQITDAIGGSDAVDVTGGMAGKVRALLDADVAARVFGLDGLESFLGGGSPGTLVQR